MPAVLPSAEAQEEGECEETAPAHGRDAAPNLCAGVHAAAGFSDAGADVHRVDDDWEQLLSQFRVPSNPVEARSSSPLVGPQPADGILLPQEHGQAYPQVRSVSKTIWVVNSEDWVDVEYVLRKML